MDSIYVTTVKLTSKEFQTIYSALQNNDYPITFIDKNISTFLNKNFFRKQIIWIQLLKSLGFKLFILKYFKYMLPLIE